MAKKPNAGEPLTFFDIVTRAEAETIRAALEARLHIDKLLAERLLAYQRICQLEEEIQMIVGDEGDFEFPPPPYAIAGLTAKADNQPTAPRKPAPRPLPKATPTPPSATLAAADNEANQAPNPAAAPK